MMISSSPLSSFLKITSSPPPSHFLISLFLSQLLLVPPSSGLVELCTTKALYSDDINILWPPDSQSLQNSSSRTEVRVSILLPATYEDDHKTITNISEFKLLPYQNRTVPAILAGLEEAINRGLLPNLYFNITIRDTKCSDDGLYPAKAWIDASESGVDVFFGPSCEYCLAIAARLNKLIKVPMITAGGLSWDFQHTKSKFENEFYLLTKTGYNFWDASNAVYKFMEQVNWRKIILMYRKDDLPEWSGKGTCKQFMSSMVEVAKKKEHIEPYKAIDLDIAMKSNSTEDMLRDQLPEFNNSIVVMCASQASIRDIMLSAEKLGLIEGGQYAFFNIDLFNSNLTTYKPWYSEYASNEDNEATKRAFQSVLTISGDTNAVDGITERIESIAKKEFKFEYDIPVNSFMVQFYDAALLYATALNETLEEFGHNALKDGRLDMDGCQITQKMWNRTFNGANEKQVHMNANGNKINNYTILDMDPKTELFKIVRIYDTETEVLRNVSAIHWPGKTGQPPFDWPICGFDGSLCIPKEKNIVLLVFSIVTSCLLVILTVVAVVTYRHKKIEADIARMYWKIDRQDILATKLGGGKYGSALSLTRIGREPDIYSIDSMGCDETRKQVFVKTGYYKGTVVAIKKIGCSNINVNNLNRGQLLDLKRMKDLNCTNLVRFIGACLDCDDPILVTEYCPRGSLQDILEDEALELDWNFRYSLIHDIIKGMGFLHSSEIGIHGNMKSSNCVVDGRFVLKLTDFGLHELRQEYDALDKNSYEYWKSKLWTSPELLRDTDHEYGGTQKGDIYAFSIILHEIVIRNGTWGLDQSCRNPGEIIESIVEGISEMRPDFNKEATDKDIINMMTQCWAENPLDRPDATALKISIKKLNKEGASSNILDNLLSRMEQYANNLETLVEERTSDYLEEKRKCEDLLYELLPKAVASRLIEGEAVQAESFASVTIFFSDIVGFTALSSGSTAIQIIDFLNDLYTCFDSIIENFDVYKVETIGDAYMIVSGLPVRNGVNHVREIARTALRIMESVKTFKIRHRPKERLKLRIGIHTGPCCSGVVGIKMPRYCLFGDTVNTASRMESNGLPLKIHVSEKTVDILKTFGTFEIEYRGEVDMKGKGLMKTYWLLGEKEDYMDGGMRDQQGIQNPSFRPEKYIDQIHPGKKKDKSSHFNNLGEKEYHNLLGSHQDQEVSTEHKKMYGNPQLGPTPDLIQAHGCGIQIHENPLHRRNYRDSDVKLDMSPPEDNWDMTQQPIMNRSTELLVSTKTSDQWSHGNQITTEIPEGNSETTGWNNMYPGTSRKINIPCETPPWKQTSIGTPPWNSMPEHTQSPQNTSSEMRQREHPTKKTEFFTDSNSPLLDLNPCNFSVL